MSEPNNTVASDRAADAVYLFSAAEASVLGDPWLLVIGRQTIGLRSCRTLCLTR